MAHEKDEGKRDDPAQKSYANIFSDGPSFSLVQDRGEEGQTGGEEDEQSENCERGGEIEPTREPKKIDLPIPCKNGLPEKRGKQRHDENRDCEIDPESS